MGNAGFISSAVICFYGLYGESLGLSMNLLQGSLTLSLDIGVFGAVLGVLVLLGWGLEVSEVTVRV